MQVRTDNSGHILERLKGVLSGDELAQLERGLRVLFGLEGGA